MQGKTSAITVLKRFVPLGMKRAIRSSLDRNMSRFRAHETVRISLAQVPSFRFEIHKKFDQFISFTLARDKVWEPFESSVFLGLLRAGDFVVDIGANIGWYSVLAARIVGATGRVWSYEPDPENYDILNRNVNRCGSGTIRTVRAAQIGRAHV